MRVFGAQEADRVLLLLDEMPHLHHLLGGVDRLVFDAIDVGRRADQRGDGDEHAGDATSSLSPPSRRQSRQRLDPFVHSSRRRAGALGETQLGRARARIGGASPLRPARPAGRAEPTKVGAAGAGSPGSRREAARPRPERRAKNCLTMRSSSEWNVTTASRPPGFSSRSAATRPRASSPSSSLTAMRRA